MSFDAQGGLITVDPHRIQPHLMCAIFRSLRLFDRKGHARHDVMIQRVRYADDFAGQDPERRVEMFEGVLEVPKVGFICTDWGRVRKCPGCTTGRRTVFSNVCRIERSPAGLELLSRPVEGFH